jgi:hypothetical protein
MHAILCPRFWSLRRYSIESLLTATIFAGNRSAGLPTRSNSECNGDPIFARSLRCGCRGSGDPRSGLIASLSALRNCGVMILCCVAVLLNMSVHAADKWIDISSSLLERLTNNGAKPAWPGGCSGVVVNRTSGDVIIKVVGLGLWRSSDKGKTWQRIDENIISGRDETGWATSVDQNAPGRIASFSLDGTAGWTTNGLAWQQFKSLGRNWDFGSVDWAAASAENYHRRQTRNQSAGRSLCDQ